MQYTFSIRVDIDTTKCVALLPHLLNLASKHEVKLTFFVNMGRSTHIPYAYKRQVKSLDTYSNKVSFTKKLGLYHLLKTLFFNPTLYNSAKPHLERALKEGHELGLHGGTNHAIWQSNANNMSNTQIEELLMPSLETFIKDWGSSFGFSSPGFTINKHAYKVLAKHQCIYTSDEIGKRNIRYNNHLKLASVPVTVVGRNRVDYLEQCYQQKTPIKISPEQVTNTDGYGAYFTHPCFAAGIGKKLFESLLVEAKNKYTIIPMKKASTIFAKSH